MADQLQLRGGNTAESQVFVGAVREVTVDTGLKTLRIHDGVTPGALALKLLELSPSASQIRLTSVFYKLFTTVFPAVISR